MTTSLTFHKKNGYHWAVVGMLWCICFLNYADRQVIFSVFPLLAKEFGFSKMELGLIGSSFMWIYAGGSFIAGLLTDRYSRKIAILGGCFFWSLITITTSWCSELWQFMTVRAMEGIGEVFYFPASNSLIADYHGKKSRSTALSLHQSGVYLGTIAGSWLGAWLAEHYGWRYGFYFFGGLGIIISFFLYRFLKEPPRDAAENRIISRSSQLALSENEPLQPTAKVVLLYVLRQPIILLLMGAFMSANFVAGIFLAWMPTFLYEKFSLTLTEAGCSAVMTIQFASVAGVLVIGRWVDYLSETRANARVALQMLSLFLGSGTIVAVGLASNVTCLMISLVCFGFCKGGYDSGIFASQFDYVEPRFRGSIVGLMNTFGWSGGALGALVLGAASSYGKGSAIHRMSYAISWSASIYLVAALLLLGVLFISQSNQREKSFSDK